MKRIAGESNLHLENRRFRTRTYTIYSHQAVLADKANTRLDYGLPELRTLVGAALGTPCLYCGDKLRGRNFSVDHMTPLSRGGSFGFDNLQVICDVCNGVKGKATQREMSQFCEMGSHWPLEARSDFRRRLRLGGTALSMFRRPKRTDKSSGKPEVLMSNEEFCLQ
jgi:HNH endonuclease